MEEHRSGVEANAFSDSGIKTEIKEQDDGQLIVGRVGCGLRIADCVEDATAAALSEVRDAAEVCENASDWAEYWSASGYLDLIEQKQDQLVVFSDADAIVSVARECPDSVEENDGGFLAGPDSFAEQKVVPCLIFIYLAFEAGDCCVFCADLVEE
jgi:hypothetical protein